jgi:chromosome segregation protein
MVTPEGDVMDPCGVITGGSDRPVEEEILSRRREMQELDISIDTVSTVLDQANAGRTRLAASEAAEGAALRELDAGVHQLTLDLVALEKDGERLEAERPRWTERLEISRHDSETLAREESAGRQEIEQLHIRLAELQVEQSSLELELQARQADSGRVKAELDGLVDQLTAARVRLAQARERQVSLAARIENVDRQREDAGHRLRDLAEEQKAGEEARDALTSERREVDEASTQARSGLASLEQRIEVASSGVRDLRREAEAADVEVNRLRERIDANRSQRAVAETSMADRRVRLELLESTIREKYDVDLVAEVAAASEDEGEPDPLLHARLEELRQRLSRIGEVNVGAIEELQELEQRAAFLRTQKEDLERSLSDLENTINKLNRASRARFRETFEQVDAKFRSVFPRLFRGGEAHLVLTDETNILESGVEIFVRPPGKRLDTVTLLSGGEKALVAVSLIFALFLIRPTPFCFLDEIDAPLDDANVGRFVHMVREISDRTQFILITHNKRTMEAADCLYGVTMEEAGVSKVISVAMR